MSSSAESVRRALRAVGVLLALSPLSGCVVVAGRRSDGHWFFWPFGLLLIIPLWFGMRRRR